jgi:hypothetical protein
MAGDLDGWVPIHRRGALIIGQPVPPTGSPSIHSGITQPKAGFVGFGEENAFECFFDQSPKRDPPLCRDSFGFSEEPVSNI